NDRSHRNLDDFVHGCASAHFFSHTVAAVFRFDQGLVEQIHEIIDMPIRLQDHVTTTPAIAAVRPASWHKFFSSKTDGAAPACSRLRKHFHPINEHAGSICHQHEHLSSRAQSMGPAEYVMQFIRSFDSVSRRQDDTNEV